MANDPLKPWKSVATAKALLEHMPAALQGQREVNKEGILTSMWLVTLTTGLLAFLLSSHDMLAGGGPWAIRAVVVCALSVVATGLLFRLWVQELNAELGRVERDFVLLLSATATDVLDPAEPGLFREQSLILRCYEEIAGHPMAEETVSKGLKAIEAEYAGLYPYCISVEEKRMAKVSQLVNAVIGGPVASTQAQDPKAAEGESKVGPPAAPAEGESAEDPATAELRERALKAESYAVRGNLLFRIQMYAFTGLLAVIGLALW